MSEFLRSHLPKSLVESIRHIRRKSRLKKRFNINGGRDILQTISTGEGSFLIYINPFLNGGVDDDIYTTGMWEPEITDLLKQYLPKEGTFLDIGANIGYHSLFAASLLSETGSVIAFEPLPRLYSQMSKSVRENSFTHVTIHNVALSNKEGFGELSLVDENIGASSLQSVQQERSVSEVVKVSLNKLDNYLPTLTRVDLIKIDIEGSEFEALKGGRELLETYKPVIILEFSPQVYEKEALGKSLDLFNFIKNLGYSISVIDKPHINIEDNLKNKNFSDLHANLLCLPS